MSDNKYAINRVSPNSTLRNTAIFLDTLSGIGGIVSGATKKAGEINKSNLDTFLSQHKEDVYTLDSYAEKMYERDSSRNIFKPEYLSVATGVPLEVAKAFVASRAYSEDDNRKNISWKDRQIESGKINTSYNYDTYTKAKQKIASVSVVSDNESNVDKLDKYADSLSNAELVNIFKNKDFKSVSKATGVNDENVITSWFDTRTFDQEAVYTGAKFTSYNIASGKITGETYIDREQKKAKEDIATEEENEKIQDLAIANTYSEEFITLSMFCDNKVSEAISNNEGIDSDKLIADLGNADYISKETGIPKNIVESFLRQSVKYNESFLKDGIPYYEAGLTTGHNDGKSDYKSVITANAEMSFNNMESYLDSVINGDESIGSLGIVDMEIASNTPPDKILEKVEEQLDSLFSRNGDVYSRLKAFGHSEEKIDAFMAKNEQKYRTLVQNQANKKTKDAFKAQTKTWGELELQVLGKSTGLKEEEIVKNVNDIVKCLISGGCYDNYMDAYQVAIDTFADNSLNMAISTFEQYPNTSFDMLKIHAMSRYDSLCKGFINKENNNINELSMRVIELNNLNKYSEIESSLQKQYEAKKKEIINKTEDDSSNIDSLISQSAINGSMYTNKNVINAYGYDGYEDIPVYVRSIVDSSILKVNKISASALIGNGDADKLIEGAVKSSIENKVQNSSSGAEYKTSPRYYTFTNGTLSNSAIANNNITELEEENKALLDEAKSLIHQEGGYDFNQDGKNVKEISSKIKSNEQKISELEKHLEYSKQEGSSDYIAGATPKDGDRVYINDSEGFDEFISKQSTDLKTNPVAFMTIAKTWANYENKYSNVNAFTTLEEEFNTIYSTNKSEEQINGGYREWLDKVNMTYAMRLIGRDEFTKLQDMLKLSDSEKNVQATLQEQLDLALKELSIGKYSKQGLALKNSINDSFNSTIKPAMLDAIYANNGVLPSDFRDKYFGSLSSIIYDESFRMQVSDVFKRSAFDNGLIPAFNNSNDISENTSAVLINAQSCYEQANNGALWFCRANNYMDNAVKFLVTQSSGEAPVEGKKKEKESGILEFTSEHMFGETYSQLKDYLSDARENGKIPDANRYERAIDMVMQNSLAVMYLANSYVDICNEAKIPKSDETIPVNIEGGIVAVLNKKTGDIYWHGSLGDTELSKGKIDTKQLELASNSNAIYSNAMIRMSNITINK